MPLTYGVHCVMKCFREVRGVVTALKPVRVEQVRRPE